MRPLAWNPLSVVAYEQKKGPDDDSGAFPQSPKDLEVLRRVLPYPPFPGDLSTELPVRGSRRRRILLGLRRLSLFLS